MAMKHKRPTGLAKMDATQLKQTLRDQVDLMLMPGDCYWTGLQMDALRGVITYLSFINWTRDTYEEQSDNTAVGGTPTTQRSRSGKPGDPSGE